MVIEAVVRLDDGGGTYRVRLHDGDGGVHGAKECAVSTHALAAVDGNVMQPHDVSTDAVLKEAGRVHDGAHVLGAVLVATTERPRERVDDDQDKLLSGNQFDLAGYLDDVPAVRLSRKS